MRTRWQRVQDWIAGLDAMRTAVVSILGIAFVAGVTYSGINSRIDNNANDIKVETAARAVDKAAMTARLDRGFDKILEQLKEVREQQTRAADDRAKTQGDLGYIKGLLKQNYDNGAH